MQLGSIIFAVLFLASSYIFASRVFGKWQLMKKSGQSIGDEALSAWPSWFRNIIVHGLLQPKMMAHPIAGLMHFTIFWGFIVVSLGTVETLIQGIVPSFDYTWLVGDGRLFHFFLVSQDIANLGVFLAVSFAIIRRLLFPPARLRSLDTAAKIDGLVILFFILGLVSTTAGVMAFKGHFDGMPFSSAIAWLLPPQGAEETYLNVTWWSHSLLLFGFMVFLPYSKHQHLIWIWPNLVYRTDKPSGYLAPMDFDALEESGAESFGASTIKDFSWKQLLDGSACVECGRCTAVCPAAGTGKILDPRKIMNHLKVGLKEVGTSKASEASAVEPIIDRIVTREELWDCTTCGACVEACPLEIKHIPAIVDMRRYMVMTEGQMPTELQNTLQNLETQSNPWGINNSKRADWAEGLDVPTMAQKSDVEYLFWVGCAGSFDDRYKKVSRSIVSILKQANISFAILGTEEKCNGDSARRAGNEYLAQMQIQENIDTLKKYQVKKVVTGCPHCFNTIGNEYPDFGFQAEVVHHSQLIADLIKEGRIKPPADYAGKTLTYHDSCYLGRHNKIIEEPRKALAGTNVNLKEMPRSKEKGFCCGAGGARMWMEETKGKAINFDRAEEAVATGAEVVATACPFCMTMMRDGVAKTDRKDDVEVLDVAELIAKNES